MTTYDLERLEVWNQARELVRDVYKLIIPVLPESEKYNLIAQMRRAVTSIPANIAEGYGRFYYQSNIQFCYIARGSLEELISHIVIAYDQGYLAKEMYQNEITKANKLVLMINGYILYLKKSKHGEHEPGFEKSLKEEQSVYVSIDNEMTDGSPFSDLGSQFAASLSGTEGE